MEKVLLVYDNENKIIKNQIFKNELELQEIVKSNPDLICLSSIFESPLLIIGRETYYMDVLAVTADAVPVIIECKKRDNPDMRYLIAQVFEYASLLNQKNYNELDESVCRYFSSDKCDEELYRGLNLKEAFLKFKASIDESDETYDEDDFEEQLSERMKNGEFYLIIVVDIISEVALRTVQFLNSKMDKLRVEIIEISKYSGKSQQIYVPKHVNDDTIQKKQTKPGKITFEDMLNRASVKESAYLRAIRNTWDEGLEYSVEMGSKGFSARYQDIPILWIFSYKIQIAPRIKRKYEQHFEALSEILKDHFSNTTDVTVKYENNEINAEKLTYFIKEIKKYTETHLVNHSFE